MANPFALPGWVHPLPTHRTIGSRFGASRSGDRPEECGLGHCGVDLFAPLGTPVYACQDGNVVTAQTDEAAGGAAGKYVKLSHGGDLVRTWYIHLDSLTVSAGQQVAAGQQIGTVGTTGTQSTPAHLHFALALVTGGRATYADPESLLASWPNPGGGSASAFEWLQLAAAAALVWYLWKR